MIVGLPRASSRDEFRVGLPPRAVRTLVERGIDVCVERKAGTGAGFTDDQYADAGARILHGPEELWGRTDLVVKVGPLAPEQFDFLRSEQIVVSTLHLAAADARQVDILLERGCTAIDVTTIEDEHGRLPVLVPLSQIAGRMVPQIAARYLQTDHGGPGILLGGAPAVPPAEVVVVGAGTVGRHAVRACLGAGARVTLLDSDFERLSEVDWSSGGSVTTFLATEATLRKTLAYADVVVGAVLIPGARTPHLVTREMVGSMRDRSLLIDISVDQGGCFETSRPTRLSDPTYVVEGITHYCVPNLPSLVARSATYATANVLLPHVAALAEHGYAAAVTADPGLRKGVNVHAGEIVHPALRSLRTGIVEDPGNGGGTL
ncbi:MAG: alanine dehydrogenase [bacterium]|nr:alanine dehydrogenase [bacterium]